jgi:phage tail protein X
MKKVKSFLNHFYSSTRLSVIESVLAQSTGLKSASVTQEESVTITLPDSPNLMTDGCEFYLLPSATVSEEIRSSSSVPILLSETVRMDTMGTVQEKLPKKET